ncbi:MAG: polysaccharide biosynthesis tyrosine autokinase [Actinomycetia bacterium]|nr:polysaccharide biosynthesis tyrosine autokinase [Actinomycetes bacterium]
MTDAFEPVAGDDNFWATHRPELDLRDYLALLRRHRLLVGIIFVLCLGSTAAFTLVRTPSYQAQSEVLVRTWANQTLFPLGTTSRATLVRDAMVEIEFAESDSFAAPARAATNAPGSVSVSVEEGSSSLLFTATSTDQDTVADLANAWADTYVRVRHQVATIETENAIETIEASITTVSDERTALLEPLAPIDDAIGDTDDPAIISQLTTQRLNLIQSMQTQLSPLDSQLSSLNGELSGLEIDRRFLEDPTISARVTTAAVRPDGPTGAGLARNLVLAAVVGAILGVAAALLRNSLDDSITSEEDLEQATGGLAVLSRVPRYEASRESIEVATNPSSSATEAYRDLLTSLELATRAGAFRTLLVTSPQSGDGKSTVALNLAALAAHHSDRVLIVDADLRRPSLQRTLGLENTTGLRSYLSGEAMFDEIGTSVLIGGAPLGVIPAGVGGHDPAELLRDWRAGELMDKAANVFDLVIIDAPPVLPVTDAVILARYCDAVIVVARAGQTSRNDLQNALKRLRGTGARPAGVVLNADREIARYLYY